MGEEKALKLSKKKQLLLYRTIVRGRAFEKMLEAMSAADKLAGWAHLGIGQESTGSAMSMLMRPEDYLVPYHRSRILLMGRGMPPELLLSEMMGRKTGMCDGLGGETHMMSAEYNLYGTGGLVGSQVPIAVGLAYGAKMDGKGAIAVCHFGEGTTARGPWHEAMNMAAVFELPLVFVCENNLYAEFTPLAGQMKVENVADRAAGYGMPGVVIDGNDPLEAYDVIGQAIERARAGGGPTLIEAKTYRHHGHFEGDMCLYRPEGELEEWLKRDPVVTFRKHLLDEGLATEAELDQMVQQAKEEMDAASDFAYNAPSPSVEDIRRPIYA